jgi:hypothetical protein
LNFIDATLPHGLAAVKNYSQLDEWLNWYPPKDENPSEKFQPSLKCPIFNDIPKITLYKPDFIKSSGGSYE